MPPSSDRSPARPRTLAALLMLAALAAAAMSYGGWLWFVEGVRVPRVSAYFFGRQDMWVLDGYAVLLAVMALWAWRTTPPRFGGHGPRGEGGRGILILLGIVGAVLLARIGRDLVFHGYSPSRDEVMVELAGAYLADGRIGWQIPPDWLPFNHAIMPEFYSPYGSDTHWTAIYLPVHAAIRALFTRIGDADLAGPAMLGVGMLALWNVARRLMPARPDAQAVTMALALSSTQLIATAMTPYAMTSHFALDMLWLALVLRGGRWGHGLAGAVALLAAGLHQWHFPLLFIAPFILWLLACRNWRAALFHALVAGAMMVIWARLWPYLLIHEVGPPPPMDAHRTNGIWDKIESLFGRLDSWQPLLNNARLVAWNNLLLLPLAVLSLWSVRWREIWRDPPIVAPLLLVAVLGMTLALYQGYGWGFRYMHGGIGALCLLAGLGWTAVIRAGDRMAFRLVTASAVLSLLAGAWLLFDTEHYVRGYARTMATIRASKADVVLVDLRGGYYMTDLVRFDHGRLHRPVVMALHMMSYDDLDRLCATHSVAIADRALFWAAGVHPVPPVFPGSHFIEDRREHLAARHCGAPLALGQAAF